MKSLFKVTPLAFREVNDAVRVKTFGEVFTPLAFVEQMLLLIDENHWRDATTIFVEPTCGDGAFLVLVVRKRYFGLLGVSSHLEAIQYSLQQRIDAMAIAIDSSFGFDIQGDNVESCRSNLLKLMVMEIPESIEAGSLDKQEGKFLAWSIAAISANVKKMNALSASKPIRFSAGRKTKRDRECQKISSELKKFASGKISQTSMPFVNEALARKIQ